MASVLGVRRGESAAMARVRRTHPSSRDGLHECGVPQALRRGLASYLYRGRSNNDVRTRFGVLWLKRLVYELVSGSGPALVAPEDRRMGLAAGRMSLGVQPWHRRHSRTSGRLVHGRAARPRGRRGRACHLPRRQGGADDPRERAPQAVPAPKKLARGMPRRKAPRLRRASTPPPGRRCAAAPAHPGGG